MATPEHADLPCVVLGGGITGLGVLRSLGRAGVRPYIVCRRGDVPSHSRWLRGRLDNIQESDDQEHLERALAEHGLSTAVLVPCSDTWAQAVASLPEPAKSRYPASISPRDVLDLLVDKSRFYETLDQLGVPHPRTRRVVSVEDIGPSELTGHFLKPTNSQKFSSTHSDKAILFSDRQGAAEGLRAMAAAGVGALLQEYVPGPPDHHYFVDGYVDREDTVRAIFVRRRTRMFPLPFGNSSHMTSVPSSEAGQALEDAIRLLTTIGFQGPFSAEFKLDPRDGQFKLLEVNGRPWWYIGFAADCGVDIALLSYRDALGLELETISTYVTGSRCVLLHLDLRAFLYERRARGLALVPWLRSVVGAHSTIFSWDDPFPAAMLMTGMVKSSLRRSLPRFGRRVRRGG